MRTLPLLSILAALLACTSLTRAAELLPPSTPIPQAIDHYIDAALREANAKPAPQLDDAGFLRRVTLDLVGRIPTVQELKEYTTSTDPQKQAKLLDRLFASPGYARHQAAEFDAMMMAGTRGSIRDYLSKAFSDNRPWDQIFREVMLPDDQDAKTKGASEFLRQRVTDLDKLTSEVSSTFFGVNVSCARCHDHPIVPDWKQDHFFGMKSFFSRTFDAGGLLAEREAGLVKFKTTKGQDKTAKMMFLTGKSVEEASLREPSAEEQKKEKELIERAKKNKGMAIPAPKFSARAQLVDIALQPGQRDFFAKNIVNRVFHRFLGLGLVAPIDQMHSENPPSHPELLDWLARDTAENKYDLKRLIRGVVLSRAYARSSKRVEEGRSEPRLFLVSRVRPLTPMQLALSLKIATSDPVAFATMKLDEADRKIEAMEGSARGFASLIEQPGEDFQVSVSEALLFSNGDRFMKEFLGDGGDRLVTRMTQVQDIKERIDLAVRATLSRPAAEDEIKLMADYLQKRPDRQAEACRQVVWALVTSPEFRFNH